MRILMTGGTGLIGRRLCKALVEAGNEVTVLSRHPESVREQCGDSVRSMASLNEWSAELSFDVVINLAGASIVDERWSDKRKQILIKSRVELTERLVEKIASAKHKPSLMLSGSAVGYYGDTGDRELDEASPAAQDFAANLCLQWEVAAGKVTAHGTRLCLLRTGLVLAAEGGILYKMLLPFKLALGARLGDGRQWMSWIHIDDYVAIVLMLLNDKEASGAYNMTAPKPVNNAEFTQTLASVLHRPAWIVAPARLLRMSMGEMSLLLLGGQRVLPQRVVAMGYHYRYPELRPTLMSLLRS